MSDIMGQILPGGCLGKFLTIVAAGCEHAIVELGTWKGRGSTMCLAQGARDCYIPIYSVEVNPKNHALVKEDWKGAAVNLHFIYGTLVKPEEFPPYSHPDPIMRLYYEDELQLCAAAPMVIDMMPEKIDLLLIDGGEWSAQAEFEKLYKRCATIVLDDTNPKVTVKNVRNRERLIEMGWTMLADHPNDRHGWCAAENPDWKP